MMGGATQPRVRHGARASRRESAREAIARGLRFLDDAVGADGAWPARRHASRDLAGAGAEESPPFVAGHGLLALGGCDGPVAERLRRRTRAFLHAGMEYPGVWRYWPRLPPDLDDTAICSLAAKPHLWLLLGRNVELLLSCRDRLGRFRTWMTGHRHLESALNPADSVVNANVVAYLGDRPQTRAAQRWLETLVADATEPDLALHYYPAAIDLYLAMARARSLAAPAFGRLRPTLTARILSFRQPDGGFVDILRTAQALTALHRLRAGARVEVVRPALDRLLEAQRSDGGWPACLAWLGQPGTSLGFGSEALTTACCVEALAPAAATCGPPPPSPARGESRG